MLIWENIVGRGLKPLQPPTNYVTENVRTTKRRVCNQDLEYKSLSEIVDTEKYQTRQYPINEDATDDSKKKLITDVD